MPTLSEVFTDIANSIRTKAGTVDTIAPVNMANAINNIPTGGGTVVLNNTTLSYEVMGKFDSPVEIEPSTMNCDRMFANAYSFNQPINIPYGATPYGYNMGLANANQMFYECHNFNQPLNFVGKGTQFDMGGLLYNCYNFNAPLDVPLMYMSTYYKEMFRGCHSFNRPIANINLGEPANMFRDCWVFNQPVGDINAIICDFMFADCRAFNQPVNFVSMWGTIQVNGLFMNCYAFNQPINTMKAYSLTDNMFRNCRNFDQPINGINSGMYQFAGCTNLNQPYTLTSSPAKGIFSGCSNFNSVINLSMYQMSDASYMFNGCSKLADDTVAAFSFYMYGFGICSHMFDGCKSLVNLCNSHANCICTQDASGMFANCSNVQYTKSIFANPSMYIFGGFFNASNIYANCYNLEGTGENEPSYINFYNANNVCYAFDGCKNFGKAHNGEGGTVLVGGDIRSYTGIKWMFNNCGNAYKKRLVCKKSNTFNTAINTQAFYSLVGKAITYTDTTEIFNGVEYPAKYNALYNVAVVNAV